MTSKAELVSEIRRFNRFYTRKIGLLRETLDDSPLTLTEARVLFELGLDAAAAESKPIGVMGMVSETLHLNVGPAASEIAAELRIDPAYMTRILRKFGMEGLTEVRPDPRDGRRRILSLTEKGRATLAAMQSRTEQEIGRMVGDLDDEQSMQLRAALRQAAVLLGEQRQDTPITLRPHDVGDVGWVIERQSKLYAEEFGWQPGYEALVCEIGGAFLKDFVPGKEFCWIAERAGERVGAVFLVQRSDEQGQLRMLHVEPSARGAGVGRLLVDECIKFARDASYKNIMLWTQGTLGSARRLYDRTGFKLVSSEPRESFGQSMASEIWEREL